MKKILSVSLAFLIAFIGLNLRFVVRAESSDAAGTVYYVDSVDGNDSNSGTSSSAPWKSLEKVNVTTFQPGDKILFKAGDAWHGQLYPKGSGKEGAPIVIDQYGDSDSLPSINGDGTQRPYHATGAVMLRNQQYWEINHLEVTNDDNFDTDEVQAAYGSDNQPSNIRDGILVVLDTDQVADGASGVMNHIYIQNCYVHDVDSVDEWPNKYHNASFSGGITFYVIGSLKPDMTFNDVRIQNNTIRKCDMLAVSNFNYTTTTDFQDEIGPNNLWQTNIYIGHNYMQDIGQGGIDLCDAKNAVVEYNVLDGWHTRYDAQSAGIYPWKSYNVTFQNNEVYGGPTTTDASNGDGTAFDFDSPNINIVYQYNYTHNNPMGWMSYLGRSDNNVARYNISDDNGAYLIKFGWFDYDKSPTYFVNNLFLYDGSKTAFTSQNNNIGYYFKNVPYYFYNNVFYDKTGTGSSTWAPSQSDYGTAVFSNNCFYTANGKHAAGEPADANKITADPELIDTNAGDSLKRDTNGQLSGATVWNGYKLQAGSPLVDKGLYVSQMGTKDFYGTNLQYGAAADVGAEEVVQGVQTAPSAPQPKSENYAADAAVTVENSSDGTNNGSAITDGSAATAWTSDTNAPQYVEIDLAQAETFNETEVMENVTTPPASGNYKPGSPAIGDYHEAYWDGSQWVTFYTSNSIGADKTDVFQPVTAQKLRFYIDSAYGQPSISEIRVFNDPDAALTQPTTAVQQADAQYGVVAHYTFDDVSGNTVPDDSGNGLDGAKSDSVTVTNDGKYGNALKFGGADGTSQDGYVAIADQAALRTSDFTISMWVKTDDYQAYTAQGNEELFSKGGNGNESYSSSSVTDSEWGGPVGGFQDPFIVANSDGSRGARWYPSTPGPQSRLVVPAGQWAQVIHTYDGHALRVYLNGTLVESVPVSTGEQAVALYQNTQELLLGNRSRTGDNAFHGLMDDVWILDKAISPNQAAALYQGTLMNAPAIAASVRKGSVVGTTAVAARADDGDTLAVRVANQSIAVPQVGISAPSDAAPYISGEDISAKAGMYIDLYELDGKERVVKFAQIQLTADDIREKSVPSGNTPSGSVSSGTGVPGGNPSAAYTSGSGPNGDAAVSNPETGTDAVGSPMLFIFAGIAAGAVMLLKGKLRRHNRPV